MSRKKLTLSVEEKLTRHAKAVAKKRGTSVSRLVETFFTALEEEDDGAREQARKPGDETTSEGGDDPVGYVPSKWAQRWRGAFAEEEKAYPDDLSWDEEVLAKEIEKKHAP